MKLAQYNELVRERCGKLSSKEQSETGYKYTHDIEMSLLKFMPYASPAIKKLVEDLGKMATPLQIMTEIRTFTNNPMANRYAELREIVKETRSEVPDIVEFAYSINRWLEMGGDEWTGVRGRDPRALGYAHLDGGSSTTGSLGFGADERSYIQSGIVDPDVLIAMRREDELEYGTRSRAELLKKNEEKSGKMDGESDVGKDYEDEPSTVADEDNRSQ